jgi:hypothetical protein
MNTSTTPAATFVVSAAQNYELAGPIKFETQFSNMAGFNSPTVAGSAPDGAFVFLAATAAVPGGVIQLKIVDVKATFNFSWLVGNSGQVFQIVISESSQGGGATSFEAASGVVNGEARLEFDSPPMYGRGDLYVRISSNGAARDWNISRGNVTATPQV